MAFIGRSNEINELKRLDKRELADFVIIQGRRRVGKSRLVKEFAKGRRFISLTGIAPTPETTAQMQRDEFARQLAEQLKLPKLNLDDWGDLFSWLARETKMGRVIILLDEISWMGSKDETFLGKLKTAWDTQFKENNKLTLFLCGSVSSWIEKNIISSTLFLGRPTFFIQLEPLPLPNCDEFWGTQRDKISAYEKLKMLAVTGGIPRYLELLNPKLDAETNLRQLCFLKGSPLVREFELIFADIFGVRSEIYKKIVRRLVQGEATQEELLQSCGRSKTGDFSDYLKDLTTAGFVSTDFTWSVKTGKLSKLRKYRLKDNYVRFYLKYIEPNKAKIEKGLFQDRSIATLPGWSNVLGLQFQDLVLNNDLLLLQQLNIPKEDVVAIGPYFQRPTKVQQGCQIDLLIQTKFNCLYVCEIKFSKNPIAAQVVKEVEEKVKRIKIPRGFSVRPVLIHVNGICDSVLEQNYFAQLVDFSELLAAEF
jgi:AAA+ ATPase superfamily predicted ATPase